MTTSSTTRALLLRNLRSSERQRPPLLETLNGLISALALLLLFSVDANSKRSNAYTEREDRIDASVEVLVLQSA